jgi:hypothetical protein
VSCQKHKQPFTNFSARINEFIVQRLLKELFMLIRLPAPQAKRRRLSDFKASNYMNQLHVSAHAAIGDGTKFYTIAHGKKAGELLQADSTVA